MAKTQFQRVVVGITDARLIGVAAKFRPERAAGSIHGLSRSCRVNIAFSERTARRGSSSNLTGLAEAQAQRRIARVRFHQNQQAMRLIAHVAGAEHGVLPDLPLDREHVLFGVRNTVANGISGNAADRDILRPIDIVSGWLLEEFKGAKVTGKYCPRFCPLEAVTNGFENKGGAGLL